MRTRIVLAVLTGLSSHALAQPLSTAFTYQGDLTAAGAPATGAYDLRFALYDAPTDGAQLGSTLCADNVTIAGGRFSVNLDFGAQYAGGKRFLQVLVRADSGLDCSDGSGYTVLGGRQELTIAPHAGYALSAGDAMSLGGRSGSFYTDAANLTGTIADARLSGNVARLNGSNTFTGPVSFTNPNNTFAGNGAGLTSLNGASIQANTLDRGSLAAGIRDVLGTSSPFRWNSPTYQEIGAASVGGSILLRDGGYVYVVSGGQLTAVDVSNPSAPVASSPITVAATELQAIVKAGSYLYLAEYQSRTIHIVSVVNPASPQIAGSVTVSERPRSLAVVGTSLCVGAEGTFELRSLSDPLALPPVGSIPQVGRVYLHLASEGTLVAFTGRTFGSPFFGVMDLSNPSTPVFRSFVSGGTPGVEQIAFRNGILYIADTYSGAWVHVYDCRQPNSISLVGSISVPGDPKSLTAADDRLFVGTAGAGVFQAYDLADPLNPTLLGSYTYGSPITDIEVNAGLAYVLSGGTMRVVGSSPGIAFSAPLEASGSRLRDLNAASISTGTIPASALSGADGSGLTNLNASALTSGTIPSARLPSTVVRTDVANGPLGLGTASPLLPLGFANTTGGKINLFSTNGSDHYGFGVQPGTLQIMTESSGSAVTFGHGRSGAFAEWARVTSDGRLRVGLNQSNPLRAGLEVAGGIMTSSSASQHNQGAHLQWNRSGSWGETWILNQRGLGIGGIYFGEVTTGNSTTTRMVIDQNGNVSIPGSLSKGGGSFKIDHPLDPANKYLYHSFVESPDMMNIYNGNVTTDERGFAVITLPTYFEALNRDFRYQLTVVDPESFALVRVSRKIESGSFEIASSVPGVEVSWQVTGIRKDAWAERHRIPTEVEKSPSERGKFLHPELHGEPSSASVLNPPARITPR